MISLQIIDVFFKESAGVVSLGAFLRVFRLFRLTKWLKVGALQTDLFANP